MNAGMSHAHESHFGPPSEPIDVAAFVQASKDAKLFSQSTGAVAARDHWHILPEERNQVMSMECSVDDIKSTLVNTLDDPMLAANLFKSHEATVASIHETADSSNRRKRRRLLDPASESVEVLALRDNLDRVQLKSWQLSLDSALFMRAPKNSDQNTLHQMKKTSSEAVNDTEQAIITITVHNRVPWGPGYLTRSSQHAVLSSQTLSDLFEAIPCTSNEIPPETLRDGEVIGYDDKLPPAPSSGCVICVEGVAYGDGQEEPDYADKLLQLLEKSPETRRPSLKKGSSIYDTQFSTLTLRLNEPYWLLHQGNCEHFLVVDQIRLLHPDDPTSGYPLTVQITPPLLDLCRACGKVPAVFSIVGDVRLGESPCVLCAPCWRNMGDPQDESVMIVPLPKHEMGW
ncbi:hypothetical protein NEOLEDRAFT_1146996 [Neolentinus lepideus HHB14362 ss-1]|uniref:snRNA-activating protein complex subunit 3 n=1 Tax=Neolentinus lepideus HHB14362 ss-1 TaxID=1314782 RepID=A0A165TI27_9AGAM|nr:hypothetical protein NEOLEDRAFT_1146996 [Neolentinus lepideus HHB14362 ss-1]